MLTTLSLVASVLLPAPFPPAATPFLQERQAPAPTTPTAARAPFRIEVVDAATGRGVPLVELETVHHLRFVTDSNGLCAVREPALFGRRVYFHLRSHGYEHPADGFGNRGFACRVEPGDAHRVRLKRINVAERLYRVTGAGIYRDTVLLGDDAPLAEPLLDGGVLGCDSVVNAIYRGRLYWFWGDTNRAAYPLGNFAATGATSQLPVDGGLPPDRGVDLDYFTDGDDFVRPMCPLEGPGPVWLSGAMVVLHQDRPRMLAHYARMESLGVRHEHGIVAWDDDTERFAKLVEFPLDTPLYPTGNPLRVADGDAEWFVFPNPYPVVRVAAAYDAIRDPTRYEAFTCLAAGARFTDAEPELARDAEGEPRWAWRADTAAVDPGRAEQLPAAWMALRDVETGEPIRGHGGTVFWNDHRERWIAIVLEVGGRSMLGEVWFAEADTLLGPWTYARRIVTHDRYSFYNVKQHPYFDEDGGRLVYFEGTYTRTFSGNDLPTPRYDYNQIMYRLDLDDPALELPEPVYRVRDADDRRWLRGPQVRAANAWDRVECVAFHALPPEPGDEELGFGTLPADSDDSPAVLLQRWTRGDAAWLAVAGEAPPGADWRRDPEPLGRVWPTPDAHPPLWPGARPASSRR